MAGKTKDVIRETDADALRLGKSLLRTARHGALAVLDADGAPMASRVSVATDIDGAPIILVSALSAHTGALERDARCSLLVGEPGKGDPLAHPRITIACGAEKLAPGTEAHERASRRFLARHPKAKLYASFADFSFFRLDPLRASLNGGFGRAYLLEREELMTLASSNEGLAEMEVSAVAHMNEDHADALDLYAAHFAQAKGAGWVLTGFDAEGLDLANGDAVLRVFFERVLTEAAQLRPMLVVMAKQARKSADAKITKF